MTRRESLDRNELVRVTYYIACVLMSFLGVFFLGKAWFAVVITMCLGAPLVNRLTQD